MGLSISGLGSGLDTQAIIAQLMQAEGAPQLKLKDAFGTNTVKAGAWTSLVTIVKGLQDKADKLTAAGGLSATSVTTNAATQVTVTGSATATPGSLSFRINQLASAQQLTTAPLSGPTAVVGKGSTVITAGDDLVGATTVSAGAGAVTGHHTVVVGTGASSALVRGTVPTATPTSGTTLQVSAGGATTSIDLSAAPTDPAAFQAYLQAQLDAGGTAARVESSGGSLVLRSTATGSAATLTLRGPGAAALGLTAGTTTGDDVSVVVDGVATGLTDAAGGGRQLTLADGTTVGFAGGPKAGTLSIGVAVTTSDTSTMADLAGALAAAGGPARAALVDTGGGTGSYRMVLSAAATGVAGALKVTSTVPALGATTELRPAGDAQLVLGQGAAALTLTRSANTVTDLFPGVTINLVKADPTTDVTVTVNKDDAAITTKVKDLVSGLNDTLGWIATNSKYDVAAKTGGPMVGDSGVRELSSQLTSAMFTQSDGTYSSAGQLGLSIDRAGVYHLDETAFAAAQTADPEGVAKLMTALATAVSTVAKTAAATGGALDVGKTSTAASAKDLQDRIDAWDGKLVSIQQRYQRQFTALDVAMKRMDSQKAWLTGQINSLP